MSQEDNAKIELLAAQVRQLQRAVAELSNETHAVSQPEQIAAKGLPALADIIRDHRAGRFETTTSFPEETR